MQQVLLSYVEAYAQSPPACLEVTEGALVGPAEAMFEVLLSVV